MSQEMLDAINEYEHGVLPDEHWDDLGIEIEHRLCALGGGE